MMRAFWYAIMAAGVEPAPGIPPTTVPTTVPPNMAGITGRNRRQFGNLAEK